MYYNEDTIIYYKGEFVKATEAKGNVYDQSLHYGYAVFEGIRAYKTKNGVKIFKAKEHFNRLQFSCEAVGIPYPFDNEELIALTYELLEKNNFTDAYIRPLVTCPPNMSLTKGKGADLLLAAWSWDAYLGEKMLRIMTSSVTRPNPKAFKIEAKVAGHYVNSIMATQEAKDLGYDEALLLDGKGFIAEGPGANLFVEKDGIFYTPQKGNILPGITRATIIELCEELGFEVIEKQLTTDEIKGADAAFFCGTAAEVIGIQSLDDVAFTAEWKQTKSAVLQKAYKNRVLEQKIAPLALA
jgi:branched-chain amino acid aminotransferase